MRADFEQIQNSNLKKEQLLTSNDINIVTFHNSQAVHISTALKIREAHFRFATSVETRTGVIFGRLLPQ